MCTRILAALIQKSNHEKRMQKLANFYMDFELEKLYISVEKSTLHYCVNTEIKAVFCTVFAIGFSNYSERQYVLPVSGNNHNESGRFGTKTHYFASDILIQRKDLFDFRILP